MKFSERWLREYGKINLDQATLSQMLPMVGHEIDSIEPVANDFNHVVIGEILQCERHPDADRLSVCQVNVGQERNLQIVCGAANARAGLKVAVAMLGAVLSPTFSIKKSKLRGVESEGMLCSSSELGLGEINPGILELEKDAPIGEDFRHYLQLDDFSIELDLTPNRGDCLSILGLSREIQAMSKLQFVPKNIQPVPPSSDAIFPVVITAPLACPRYVGRVIKNVDIKAPTPLWLRERLRRCQIRSIDPIVDITNYVMLELGQPLHAFDLNTLTKKITVRYAKKDESLTLLDDSEIALQEDCLVIADDSAALALAGIMGGKAKSIGENTRDIFLESAFFTPSAIAGRARRFGLHTDSSHRFERGVDPQLQSIAIERATQLLLEIVGGEPGPVIDVHSSNEIAECNVTLRYARIQRILGITLPKEEIELILTALGMSLKAQSDGWQVRVPSYRFDVTEEVDLIEEIARIHGYNNFPEELSSVSLQVPEVSEASVSIEQFADQLVALGYREAITYSFVDAKSLEILSPDIPAIALLNPISAELSHMRTSLWPGLLQAWRHNQHRQQPQIQLFEIGLRFIPKASEMTQQDRMLAGLVAVSAQPEQWGLAHRTLDFFDVKAHVESLLAITGDSRAFSFENGTHPALHPGQSATIMREGEVVGHLGVLHPQKQLELDLQGPVVLFELALSGLSKAKIPEFKAWSKYPAIRRDLACVVKSEVSARDLTDHIRKHGGELLKSVEVFDVYAGKGLAAGEKSVALALTLQHSSRTLTESDITSFIEEVVAGLVKTFDVNLRSGT